MLRTELVGVTFGSGDPVSAPGRGRCRTRTLCRPFGYLTAPATSPRTKKR